MVTRAMRKNIGGLCHRVLRPNDEVWLCHRVFLNPVTEGVAVPIIETNILRSSDCSAACLYSGPKLRPAHQEIFSQTMQPLVQADENCFTGQLTSHIRSEFAEECYDLYASISKQIRRVIASAKKNHIAGKIKEEEPRADKMLNLCCNQRPTGESWQQALNSIKNR